MNKILFSALFSFAFCGSLFAEDNVEKQEERFIVAINHDDLAKSDYIGTRSIYEKYGFHANFNFILTPFANVSKQEEMVENVKLLIENGNHLGLHAIMGGTFWWLNKMFDVRPDGSATFAPRLDEVQTTLDNGKNVFGYEVTGKKMSQMGFVTLPSSLSDIIVDEITEEQFNEVIANYSFYFNKTYKKGLDLDGVIQNWPLIKWMEYWYNELIDNTLGYSTISESLSEQFEADYLTAKGFTPVSCYPDAIHLENGKVVKFDDIENPNFNNPDYQKVGYFKNGLFKDCISTCNYEVADRCIEIAKAFCKHYFGTDAFTNYGRHGVQYCNSSWMDDTGVAYDNREKTVIAGEVGYFFQSLTGCFKTGEDILVEQGFTMLTGPTNPRSPIFESQIGLYYGQSGVRYPFFNSSLVRDYLDLLGTSASYTSAIISNEFFQSFVGNQDNLLKFFYENAGKQLMNVNGELGYVHNYFKNAIDHIRSCIDTGKIPSMSFDTIKDDISVLTAVELLSKFCQQNCFMIVPFEIARQEALSYKRALKDNMFPNPAFANSLLPLLGGESSNADAYIPDGWTIDSERNQEYVFDVADNGGG